MLPKKENLEEKERTKHTVDSLYKDYVDDLFSYALGFGFDKQAAMDAIHDVFCRVCIREKDVQEIQNPKFYLLRALRNQLIDTYKLKRNYSEVLTGEITDELPYRIKITVEDEMIAAEEQAEGQTLEEKMALLEKSYELAARYNGKQPDAPAAVNGRSDRKDRTAVRPVKQVQNQVVSSLAQPMGNEDFIAEFAGERNTGFHTPIGRTLPSGRNTIAACVHGTQTVSDGQVLRIRLLEPMAVDDRLIPQGTVLTGGTRIQGERMDILVETVEYKGTLFPVELEVYDADGQQGILVPNSMEYDAAREIAAGMGTSMGSSINISTDAGAQIASDVGKGVIQGVSQYVEKKMRAVKITLKAGHRLLLHSPEK